MKWALLAGWTILAAALPGQAATPFPGQKGAAGAISDRMESSIGEKLLDIKKIEHVPRSCVSGKCSDASRQSAAPSGPPGLFGSREAANEGISAFTKWTGMLKRYDDLMHRQARTGRNGKSCIEPVLYGAAPCARDAWETMVESLKSQPAGVQLETVNRFLNAFPYMTDPINWGVADYWADPAEFFRKSGDCEDYAISKYLTLKALGIEPARMRIVILEDLNLHVSHAVLAVAADDDWKILDNQSSEIVSHRLIHHYQPIYSINESGWWLHRPAP